MPSISVSLSGELFTQINDKAISPSKAMQLGAKLLLEYGINGIDAIIKENRDRANQINDFLTINEELKERVKNLKEELDFCRKELMKHEKKTEKKDKPNREDPADRLMNEVKEESG